MTSPPSGSPSGSPSGPRDGHENAPRDGRKATPQDDIAARLHAALTRTVAARDTSPAPVDRILAAGRVRRARRRTAAVAASAACILAVGLAAWLPRLDTRTAPEPVRSRPPLTATPRPSQDSLVTARIAHGMVDGTAWSVTLEYRPELHLLCQRMLIGTERVDSSGGPWSDCQTVHGAYDPATSGEEGLWGLSGKGTEGLRLFVANCTPDVASGAVTLTDGTRLTARTVTMPGTGFRAWAVAIPDHRTIASVDQYDAGQLPVSHDTQWR